MVACSSGGDLKALCVAVENLETVLADPGGSPDYEGLVSAVAAELPDGYATDLALFYAPYGGGVPPDADGAAAAAAGDRLTTVYDEECGEDRQDS